MCISKRKLSSANSLIKTNINKITSENENLINQNQIQNLNLSSNSLITNNNEELLLTEQQQQNKSLY